MVKEREAIKTVVRQFLRDELKESDQATDFQPDELDLYIDECIVEISQKRPYEVKETLTASNKSGVATATTAAHLIDTVNAHFVAGDIGKTVYNGTDKTTAKVTVYNSESDLTLDTDIMASEESYTLYCFNGTSGKDLNIASITDRIEVERVEYPTRQDPPAFDKKFTIFGDILTLGIDSIPSDGDEVFLYCHKVHQLTKSVSTLTADLEKVLVEGIVAKAARTWLNQMRSHIVPASNKWYATWANNQYLIYQKGLSDITPGSKAWEF